MSGQLRAFGAYCRASGDECRRLAKAIAKDPVDEKQDQAARPEFLAGLERDAALWTRLADEVDRYLAGDPEVVASTPVDHPALFDEAVV